MHNFIFQLTYVSLVMDYNNVYNTTGGNNYPVGILVREGHDLSVDPQFENTEGYDFRLKSTSVLVDAGINLPDVSSDIDNTSRPQGNKFDMGAYESDYTQILPPNAIPATFYTSPSNLMTLLAQYTGEMTQSQFAMQNTYSSLYVGDINTDGYDDVLVGGRHTVPNGGFYAFFGKTTPTNTEALNANVIIRGTISGSRISDNVSMGDIDGDGKNELLITDYNAFKAYIFKTGTGFSSTDVSTTNATISGPNHFGVGSAILGDVNGDGYDDYIVYADTGKKAYLFYGSPTIGDKSYTEANVVYSVDADISFTRPGDVSGDGLKDIVISCAGCNSGHGAIYIFYGSSNLTNKTLSQADVIISGDSYPYSLGTWSALSDVNGDGIDDIITVNGSKTFVFFGSNTLTNKTSINANVTISNGIQFTESSGPGFSVESADINNDIYKDLIVTDYWIPRTYVFFGPLTTSKTTDQADLVYDYRETQKGYVGGPIATGDVNNDGYIDIITGDGQYNQRTGKVWLFTSPHGTPSISLNNMGNTNNLTITGSVSDTLTVGGVEVSTDNGSWNTCTVSSGNFTCSLSSTLSDGSHSLRLRSKNSLGVYMATREYTTANFTYDKTSPQVDWTDTSGNKKKYESTGNDNVFTTDQLPTFNFTKSSDTTSGLSKYQILVNDNLYIDSIDPTKPSDKDYREDDDKYVKYDGNNNISVHAKKDKDRLTSGKAYKWKIRAIDSAGNSTDTQEKILRVNTHEANFSNTWFPLTLLNIGGKNINFSSIASDKIPSSLNINSTTPTFYGIAPVGTKVTLKIEKENDSNTGRDLVLSTTSSANESSRFGINVTDKLNTKTEYFINLSSVNPQGDYVELPEFKLNVGGSNILQNIEEIFKPKEKVPTPTKKGNSILDSRLRGNDTKNKQKHCFLFICW